ncbi:ADP-ribosylglycohydrolase family protein [Azohydromonas lata]|uniref:ADP-ribosylglycohydrolase family protein n=1 Tax=Azohydromonas lata TaxID=45677 RepID=A0ABU5I839_9BURK|nr:ADP-ribosylglycohydrolase family protein [Azohydromonas lata]MDZ5455262.1 ADP-ribosylglycohydrolase family protein [Azohydromonas lata]
MERLDTHAAPGPGTLPSPANVSRFQGCLLGGAVGDALGAPVEFKSREQILKRFGPAGITALKPAFGGIGRITDDTQMTLFTAEGLLRGWVRGCLKGMASYPAVVSHAYLRWLSTQGLQPSCTTVDVTYPDGDAGWLLQQPALHSARAPGRTCLMALQSMKQLGEPARNTSKGCGGVMRVAPAGLFVWSEERGENPRKAFELGNELAVLTHGHPTGSLTAGVLAVLVQQLADGRSLIESLDTALACLRQHPGHEETLQALQEARSLARSRLPAEKAVFCLGEGWVAEEALAVAVYCALVAQDFRHGVLLAVNHDGDSDSTGAIAGHLLGTLLGVGAIPPEWLGPLELREVVTEVAQDLHDYPGWRIGEGCEDTEDSRRIWSRYPGF